MTTADLIRHVRLLHFDFRMTPSRDTARAVADCQALLADGDADEAGELWDELVGIAARKRADGGSLDLAGLLAALPTTFRLKDHPDYRGDWNQLRRISRDVLDDIRADVGSGKTLERAEEAAEIHRNLSESRICVIAGESGCGKSSLAKSVGTRFYDNTIALPSDLWNASSLQPIEQRLGVRSPLAEILRSTPSHCLLFLDSMERVSEQGLRLAARTIVAILGDERLSHVDVLVATQHESTERICREFVQAKGSWSKPVTLMVELPSDDAIRELLNEIEGISWSRLRDELRPLLRNLKILDWVISAHQTGADFQSANIVGLPSLIDYLWNRWVEGEPGDVARGGLLKKLATIEGERLDFGVALTEFDHAELQSVSRLVTTNLVRCRDERIRFTHDLLGDWARLRVLIGADPTASAQARSHYSMPRWHRAVRLYGRCLLARTDGVSRWLSAVRSSDDGTTEGILFRDLLLESLIVSENARQLLSRAWSALIEDEGLLLQQLLDRFLIVSTVVDVRLPHAIPAASITPQVEAAFRTPLWAHWPSVLVAIEEGLNDVRRLAPIHAARVCRLWLQQTIPFLPDGTSFPHRRTAGQIAIQIAREMQARIAENDLTSGEEDQVAYEAALLAAPELPDDVAALALELAQRRPASPAIQRRAEAARERWDAEARRRERENPERERQMRELCRPVIPHGELLAPWPDGPCRCIESGFRNAVLNTGAILALAATRPDAAMECLLAVCIEPPRYEDPLGVFDQTECGVETWFEGHPPLYFRGPFLKFNRLCPSQGVEFSLRLINFASERWVESESRRREHVSEHSTSTVKLPFSQEDAELGVTVEIDGERRVWGGDRRVFRWPIDWPLGDKIISCVLMALEKWIEEQLQAGVDVGPMLNEIIQKSRSVAFGGLLTLIGKRKPGLFLRELRPLLKVLEFYHWEYHIAVERSSVSNPVAAWWNQPSNAIALARNWFEAKHRQYFLPKVIAFLMVQTPSMDGFWTEVRESLSTRLNDHSDPQLVRMLVEQFNRENYQQVHAADGRPGLEFVPSKSLSEEVNDEADKAETSLSLLIFPSQCRQILDGEKVLRPEDVEAYWNHVQKIAEVDLPEDHERERQASAIMGAIAVLLRFHAEWLSAREEHMAWCRGQICQILEEQPPRPEFDCRESPGERTWDCFLAEAGVCLLRADPDDSLAREIVAVGVAGYRYETTRRTMRLAFEFREQFGKDFEHLQQLANHWGLISSARELSERFLADVAHMIDENSELADNSAPTLMVNQLKEEVERWRSEHQRVVGQFVDR